MKKFQLKHIGYQLFKKAHYIWALKTLKVLEKEYPDLESRFIIPFDYKGKGFFKSIKPMQSKKEISDLYKIVAKQKPHGVLEIGTCHGGTLYLWAQAAAIDAVIISIDLPYGEFGGGYYPCRIPFYQSFALPKQKIHLLQTDTHETKLPKDLSNLLNGEMLDFLFIDGDHSYQGVKQDFDLYSGLVKPGGLIAMHDILPREDVPSIEVYRFWREINTRFQTTELISNEPGDRKIGIGLIEW